MLLFILCFLSLLAHFFLIPVGLNLTDSEFASFLLWADSFRHGNWLAFAFQQNYGGAQLPLLRAVWCSIWHFFDRGADMDVAIRAHMTFSYGVCPSLMTLSSYALLRQYCSRYAAAIAGIVCALGFQFWIFEYSNDLYPDLYIFGCLLLAARSRFANPFWEMTKRNIFLAGVLCGLAYYAMPAAQLYILAFLIPLPWLWSLRRQLWWPGVVVAGAGVYLEVFGRDLGMLWGGRVLKLDGKPALHFGIALQAIAWCVRQRKIIFSQETMTRVALLISGFLIGDLPEIFYCLQRGHFFPQRQYDTYDFPTSLTILGHVPQSFQTLIGSGVEIRPLSWSGHGVLDVFSTLLFTWALFVFARSAYRRGSEKGSRAVKGIDSLLLVAAGSLFAYCRVFTKVPEFAPPRYLFPLFPVLVASLGILIDEIKKKNTKPLLQILLLLLLVGHAGNQLVARIRLIDAAKQSGREKMMKEVVQVFRKTGVQVVVSEDFWHSNVYSVLSQGRPLFWANWRDWGPFEAKRLAASENIVGILVKSGGPEEKTLQADLVGRQFILSPLAHVGDRALFLGVAKEVQ